jgi:hypothetical protein
MEPIRCITFDKKAQDSLPQHIKDKMKADRKKAESEQKNKQCICNKPDLEWINSNIRICTQCGKQR